MGLEGILVGVLGPRVKLEGAWGGLQSRVGGVLGSCSGGGRIWSEFWGPGVGVGGS